MRVLGLDLGSASIGWALVDFTESEKEVTLLGAGSRIIQYSSSSAVSDFNSGKTKTACGERTRLRGMRRNLDRWQLHRAQLVEALVHYGLMIENEVFPPLNPIETWKLRADAAAGVQLKLSELARVLLQINHRRGYKHAKADMAGGKETEYVARINNLYNTISAQGLTPGQYFHKQLSESATITPNGRTNYHYRIKEQVLPRRAYDEETRKILREQQRFYPTVLTDEVVAELHNLIFYQRPLKSCKHLVSRCEFESRTIKDASGVERVVGPKVAPVSSPIAQVCRLYEAINNISLTNSRRNPADDVIGGTPAEDAKLRKYRYAYILDAEERQRIFEHMNVSEKLTFTELLKILKLKKADGFTGDKLLAKGIKGNATYVAIQQAISELPKERQRELLRFNITIAERPDTSTGEMLRYVTTDYQREPLHMLWHTLYSIDDRDELFATLRRKFGITHEPTLDRLFALDFTKAGYANKSARFICRILPYLQQGMHYSEACERVGVNHSNSITKEENAARPLLHRLPPLPNGSLRQPLVEKVVNQTINVVNAIKERYGDIDEVRVELARELKQNSDARAETTKAMARLERDNEQYAAEVKELGIVPTRRRVRKMRMLKEADGKCFYCQNPVSAVQFVEGHGYEIEHIIPVSRYFDDSFANTVCACRRCNADKGNRTAFEFMKTKSETEFNAYKERVTAMWQEGKISRKKMNYLLTDGDAIPESFINRDLNETQYITRKVMELLRAGFRTVSASSGAVTDFFRHAWGYDTVLHDLNLPKYEAAGLAETVDYETHGQHHTALQIKDWSKRRDHRHHAVDALVVALTRPKHIHRLNTLNATHSNPEALGNSRKQLERWAAAEPHVAIPSVKSAVEAIAVSFKAGKKLATPGKRITGRNGSTTRTLVPRGPLHKDTVYGEILVPAGRLPLAKALIAPELIQDPQLRAALRARLEANGGDVKATVRHLRKSPILSGGEPVSEVVCYKKKVVGSKMLKKLKLHNISDIVDPHIRAIFQKRAENCRNDTEFCRSITENPPCSDAAGTHRIKRVRCFVTASNKSVAMIRNNAGEIIGFCPTENNHHLALYQLPDGSCKAVVSSVWECIKRKRYGLPTVIHHPAQAWQTLWNLPDNDDITEIARGLPPHDSRFLLSLQQNEMVILGMSDDELRDAIAARNLKAINSHLYRVWSLAAGDYCFKFHTNTVAEILEGDKETKAYYRLKSLKALFALNPKKVRTSLLGELLLDELTNELNRP